MKKQNNSARTDVTTLPILPGTILITVGILLAFLVLMAVLYSAQILTPPAFLEGLFFQGAEDTPDDGFADQFLSSLTGHSPLNDPVNEKLLNLTPDTLRDIILNTSPVEEYYHSATVTWTAANDHFTVAQIYCLVSGDKLRGEIYYPGSTSKQLIADTETLYIREGQTSRRFSRLASSDFTPEGELALPSLARMQRMIADTEEGKYYLEMETVLDSPCIRATFTDTVSGVKEVFDIMPDYGIIVNAASYMPDEPSPYYTMQTNTLLTDISGFEESLFEIPTS